MTAPRSNTRILLGSILHLASSQVLSRLLVLGLFVALARVLSQDEFGVLASVLFGYGFLFGAITDLGLRPYVMREVSVHPAAAEDIVARGMTARLVCAALTALLMVAILVVAGRSWYFVLLALLGLAQCFVDYTNYFLKSVFRAREQMGLDAGTTIFGRLLYVVATGGALALGLATVELVLGIGVIAYLVESLLVVRQLRTRAGLCVRLAPWSPSLVRLVRVSSTFLWLVVLVEVIRRLPVIVVEGRFGEVAAGLVGGAYRLFDAAAFLPAAILTAALPRIAKLTQAAGMAARAGAGGDEGMALAAGGRLAIDTADPAQRAMLARSYGALLILMFALLGPALLFAGLEAPRIVRLLLGDTYDAAVPAFRAYAAWLGAASLSTLAGNAQTLVGMERRMVWRAAQACAVFAGALWMMLGRGDHGALEPWEAAYRAALAVLLGELLWGMLAMWDSVRAGLVPLPRWERPRRESVRATAFTLGAFAVVCGGSWWLARATPDAREMSLRSLGVWFAVAVMICGCWLATFRQVRHHLRTRR